MFARHVISLVARRSYSTPAVKADVTLIARLRKEKGLSVSRCKEALLVNGNDYDKALLWLNETEMDLAQQKATNVQGRAAVNGLIASSLVSPSCGVLLEINAETDFAARNENFIKLVRQVRAAVEVSSFVSSATASSSSSVLSLTSDDLVKLKVPGGDSVSEHVVQTIGLLGEKISVRRAAIISQAAGGLVSQACLSGMQADIGRIGALISLKASARPEPLPGKLQEFFAQMAMQVAGMNPKCILVSDEALKGLPEAEAAEKALMTQPFLFDQNMTVRQKLQEIENEFKEKVAIDNFIRFETGEGLEIVEKDFASEVMEQVNKSSR